MAKTFMSEEDFTMMMGKISCENGEEGKIFVEKIKEMKKMLDETDGDDYFGTEGWRRHFGWED